jgi:hypothetical protein
MTEWVRGETFKFGNVTVNVHRPVLTPAEQKKRERQVQDTLSRVMREYIHNKEAKPHE